MKDYKVKVTRYFTDKMNNNCERNVGDEFVCDEERYNFLKDNNAVELVEIISEAKYEEVVKEEKQEIIEKAVERNIERLEKKVNNKKKKINK